jgi:hypothetical protein
LLAANIKHTVLVNIEHLIVPITDRLFVCHCAEVAVETLAEASRKLLCFGGSCVRPLSKVQSHKVGVHCSPSPVLIYERACVCMSRLSSADLHVKRPPQRLLAMDPSTGRQAKHAVILLLLKVFAR